MIYDICMVLYGVCAVQSRPYIHGPCMPHKILGSSGGPLGPLKILYQFVGPIIVLGLLMQCTLMMRFETSISKSEG
jgi:hypothetical protein